MPTATCTIDGCEGRVVGRGYCRKHYSRWYTYGDPLFLKQPRRTMGEDERFWSWVDKRGPDECWPWTGHVNDHGYGRCRHSAGRLAPRVAFYLANGYLPESADHECHNRDVECPGGVSDPHRLCCNPAHIADRASPDNAAEAFRTRKYCKNGHEVQDDGRRYGNYRCRECYAASRQRSKAKQVAKNAGGPGKAWRTGVQTDACAHGHPWVDGSYRVYSGKRQCIECKARRARELRLRRKAEAESVS